MGEDTDPRFLSEKEGGVFAFAPLAPITDFNDPEEKEYCSMLRLNGLIVGIAMFRISVDHPDTLRLSIVTVDKNLRGLKYSNRLLKEVFTYAKLRNVKKLFLSEYTDDGEQKLKSHIQQLAQELQMQIES